MGVLRWEFVCHHLIIPFGRRRSVARRHLQPAPKEVSEARSMLTGRIVDSYTNILTVKLFARARMTRMTMCATPSISTPALFYRSLRLNTCSALAEHAQRHAGHRHRRASRMLLWSTARSRSARWRWRCRCRGRSSTSQAG